MRRVLNLGIEKIEIMKSSDVRPGEAPMAFATKLDAEFFIKKCMRNPSINQALRNFLREISPFAILSKLGDQEVSGQLVRRLMSGEIKVIQQSITTPTGTKTVEEEEEEAPARVIAATAEDNVHWIKIKMIQIVGKNKEKTAPSVKLRVKLPNGNKTWDTKNTGMVNSEGLPPGKWNIEEAKINTDVFEVVEFSP